MRANSRLVHSSQADVHQHLARKVSLHATTSFLKPVAQFNRETFMRNMEVWQAAGAPPLILDSGCGVGLSTLHLAARFPQHFVIGVDRSAHRTARNTLWPDAPPDNCIRVRADLVDYWRLMLEAGVRPARHYLLYPNPWPKQQHLGRRWHGHPVFPAVVALGGHFECRSNWRTYIAECAAALSQLTASPVQAEPFSTDGAVEECTTPFEQKYAASGHALWRCRTELGKAANPGSCDYSPTPPDF